MTEAADLAPLHAPVAVDSRLELPLRGWLSAGLRAAFLLPPRVEGRTPTPLQLFVVAISVFGVDLMLQRLSVAGGARFDVQAWLSGLFGVGVFVALLGWLLTAHASSATRPALVARHSLAACTAVWLLASLPNTLLYGALMAALAHGWSPAPALLSPVVAWVVFGVTTVWSLAVSAVLAGRMAGWTWRVAVLVLVLAGSTALMAWQFTARPWQVDEWADGSAEAPRLHLSQQLFEDQQALLAQQLNAIRPPVEVAGEPAQVYGLVYAPYAAEDVFKRESALVADVLAQRFDAQGRVVQLLNHAATAQTHPWATPLNLQRALHGLAQRMNTQRDVLVVYLTSHGAQNFQLAASHEPLEVEPLTPAVLRGALDAAGIRHRVVAVSACYSGGWVDVLADPHTLVMTAADATHTSYGCGRLSELTFFGRALFDEQLRRSHSFEQAFAAAVPIIRQREIDAGKPDGFSNPQIRTGEGIAPVLKALAERLDAALVPAPPLISRQ